MDTLRKLPPLLTEITDPPNKLYIRGTLPDTTDLKWISVVGSRKYSNYGRDACEKIISGLRNSPVVIVSGLALGLDSIAHKAALSAGLPTVAVPGSGLGWDVIHPRSHVSLAKDIIQNGGALVSEFEEDFKPTMWSFPKRNRIMAGLSHAVLIVEGLQKSGTMITARLATEYNRDVLAVPGPITSPASAGTNRLIKDGAVPITSADDVLEVLGIKKENMSEKKFGNLSEKEQRVVELLQESLSRDELIRQLNMETSEANTLLSAMEIKGLIKERLGEVHLA